MPGFGSAKPSVLCFPQVKCATLNVLSEAKIKHCCCRGHFDSL